MKIVCSWYIYVKLGLDWETLQEALLYVQM